MVKIEILDLSDELNIWKSYLPQFIIPQTHHFPDFISWCHVRYVPNQRAVVSQNNKSLFTITVESINQMLQIQNPKSLHPSSLESLMDIYKNIDFLQRAKIFETSLPKNVQLPKTNPPYQSSMFPEMTKQIISIVSCLLGYYSD